MTSIHTNTSAMGALSTLRDISRQLGVEQGKISSGLRVQTASDNASYWSISTTMRSDVKALAAVSDSIGITGAILDTAYTGMEQVHSSFVEIRSLVILASGLPVPDFETPTLSSLSAPDPKFGQSTVGKIDDQIQNHLNQAKMAIESSSFAGVNLLHRTITGEPKARDQVYSFVIGYDRGGVQTMDVKAIDTLMLNDDNGSYLTSSTFDINPDEGLLDGVSYILDPDNLATMGYYLFNLQLSDGMGGAISVDNDNPLPLERLEQHVAWHGSGNRREMYDKMIRNFDVVLEGMSDRMAYLGSLRSSVSVYENINKSLSDTINKGIGQISDADMNESSARIRALQTQENLALQALNIANSEPSRLLELFS